MHVRAVLCLLIILGMGTIKVEGQITTLGFAQRPTVGDLSIKVFGKTTHNIAVYMFGQDSTVAFSSPLTCASSDLPNGRLLPIAATGAAASATDFATLPSTTASSYSIPLTAALVSGSYLCLVDLTSSSETPQAIEVKDESDFGRVRTFLTLGVQITNQQASSSSAAEYLQAGFSYDLLTASNHNQSSGSYWHPGVQTLFDVRVSPIPVSAPASSGTVATPTLASLNLLSSQQSTRVRGEIYFPIKFSSWGGSNAFTLAPLAKVGFATLLSPSVTMQGSNANQTILVSTSSDFSPVYSITGFGGRLAWDQYPAGKTPHPVMQLNVTMSRYSNLPSYICTTNKGAMVSPAPAAGAATPSGLVAGFNTACGTTGAYSTLNYVSRTLIPRLDVEGLAKLPGKYFVVGIDANLAQYSVGKITNLDYLNKAGNDIRVYLGFSLPFSQLTDLFTGK